MTAEGGLIRMDGNRDGTVSAAPTYEFMTTDATLPSSPYRFWLNNDSDQVDSESVDGQSYESDIIVTDADRGDYASEDFEHHRNQGWLRAARDLEDFTVVQVKLPPGFKDQERFDADWDVWLQLDGDDDMAVNLLPVAEEQARLYRDDESVATQIRDASFDNRFIEMDGPDDLTILSHHLDKVNELITDDNQLYFLLEAGGAGDGTLSVEWRYDSVLDGSQLVLHQDLVHLSLRPITDFYEHWTVGDTRNWGDIRELDTPAIPLTASLTNDSAPVGDREMFEDEYVLFVHGWRMIPQERRNFAETAFKRMYWQGYDGRFGLFSWPTEWMERPDGLLDKSEAGSNYRRSEQKAWHSAFALKTLLRNLSGEYGYENVHMFAHSMGNIVASEALRLEALDSVQQKVVGTYVATQAAVPAEAYDPTVIATLFAAPQDQPSYDGTPRLFQSFPLTNRSYFEDIHLAASKLVNFYSPEDYATGLPWRVGQRFKPDDLNNGYEYDYFGNTNQFEVRWTLAPVITDRVLDIGNQSDRYEIFAYGVEAQSNALGTDPVLGTFARTGTLPETQVNIGSSGLSPVLPGQYRFTLAPQDHSAQFNDTLAERRHYWNLMMKRMGLDVWNDLQPGV